MSLIKVCDVTKTYKGGDGLVEALKGINLEIAEGEFLALMGPSGSGKSTLLSVLGGLNPPTSGKLMIDDIDVYALAPERLAEAELGILRAIGFRRRHIYSILIREVALVSLSGGVLGYLLGELTPLLLGPIAFQKTVSFQFNPLIALTAISASLVVGIVSIILARRAISLNPLEALSYI